jgi:hypothetical protein
MRFLSLLSGCFSLMSDKAGDWLAVIFRVGFGKPFEVWIGCRIERTIWVAPPVFQSGEDLASQRPEGTEEQKLRGGLLYLKVI